MEDSLEYNTQLAILGRVSVPTCRALRSGVPAAGLKIQLRFCNSVNSCCYLQAVNISVLAVAVAFVF